MASNKSSILVYSHGKDVAVFVVYVCMYVCMLGKIFSRGYKSSHTSVP